MKSKENQNLQSLLKSEDIAQLPMTRIDWFKAKNLFERKEREERKKALEEHSKKWMQLRAELKLLCESTVGHNWQHGGDLFWDSVCCSHCGEMKKTYQVHGYPKPAYQEDKC